MIVLTIMIILQTLLLIYAYLLQNITSTHNNCYNLTIFIGYLICFILYKKIKKQKKVMFFSLFLSIILITYCIFEKRYFYNDGTDYARFNCNIEDIESIIKRSEENTKEIMPFGEFDDADGLAHRFEIKDKEKYTIYIMKKPESGNYTSGIIASKEKREIILFFATPQMDYKRIEQ